MIFGLALLNSFSSDLRGFGKFSEVLQQGQPFSAVCFLDGCLPDLTLQLVVLLGGAIDKSSCVKLKDRFINDLLDNESNWGDILTCSCPVIFEF